jgi:Lrp/AsnC family transcriptional regulator for asnA, asnC and gidA
MPQLDDRDMGIIEMLEEDSRQSFKDIAKKLKVSEATIRKRVIALRRDGVIKRFTIKVDNARLGLNTVAIVGVDVDPTRMLDVAQTLCGLREAKCVATASGDHMIMLEVWTRDGRELTKLISGKIETIEGVKRICPSLILEKLKD